MTDDCKHPRIQTWRFKDSAEVAGLWSCTDCGRRFEPLTVAQPATDAQISAAIAAERERCAGIIEDNADACNPYSSTAGILRSNAAAIRAGG